MKKYLAPGLKLSLISIVLCSVLFPLLITLLSKLSPGQGRGETLSVNGRVVGYVGIGQKFTEEKYFWGRPSAVEYNASGSGGSNKSASNPDYLKQVQGRIDTFLLHNPGVQKKDIPADLVTASGSGLDPDISPAAAFIQVARISRTRNISAGILNQLVTTSIEKPVLGLFGPAKINVLKLNMALDAIH